MVGCQMNFKRPSEKNVGSYAVIKEIKNVKYLICLNRKTREALIKPNMSC